MNQQTRALSCPSAQPDMEGARLFGVIGGTEDAPRVSYLEETAPLEAKLVRRLGVVQVGHVFRIAAACDESRCAHHDGQKCSLGERIVRVLSPVVDKLPACMIRSTCRWHAERGAAACVRCPQVVTSIPRDEAARPSP